jgi:arylsulfatase A-like enzyme
LVGYPDLLAQAGYVVGLVGKGWGPGTLEGSGRAHNPAGPRVQGFAEFLKSVPQDRPFCFWFGSTDPHRPYEAGAGRRAGLAADRLAVPAFLPDTPEVRSDLLDYLEEVERFDRQVGELLEALEASGRAENTLVIVTSDNGMPFPRAKTNLYDAGTRVPLAIRWPPRIPAGQESEAFVSLCDLAPSILEAADVERPREMVGRSLLGLAADGRDEGQRDRVFTERERHANVRRGDLGYPARAVRTHRWLYVRNLRPERWPAGDPELYHSVGPFGDIDGGPTKDIVLAGRDGSPAERRLFELAAGKRPAEELYDCQLDPAQAHNLADDPAHAATRAELRGMLDQWMQATGDPRAASGGGDDRWDAYEYVGPPAARDR